VKNHTQLARETRETRERNTKSTLKGNRGIPPGMKLLFTGNELGALHGVAESQRFL